MKRWIYGNSKHLIKALEELGYEKWRRGAGFRRKQFHVIIHDSEGKIRINIHEDLPRGIVDPLPHKVVRRGPGIWKEFNRIIAKYQEIGR